MSQGCGKTEPVPLSHSPPPSPSSLPSFVFRQTLHSEARQKRDPICLTPFVFRQTLIHILLSLHVSPRHQERKREWRVLSELNLLLHGSLKQEKGKIVEPDIECIQVKWPLHRQMILTAAEAEPRIYIRPPNTDIFNV